MSPELSIPRSFGTAVGFPAGETLRRPPPAYPSGVLGMLLLTAALLAACFLIGGGILALCGDTRWRWWAPSLGYAVLLIVGGQVLKVPKHGTAIVLIILLAAGAALALPVVRRGAVEAAPEALLFGLVMMLVAAIPFFATGRAGVLGASVSNDMSQHLTAAFYLRTGQSLRPVAAIGGNLITTGYPLGPHGLAVLLTRASGLGEERAFAAITLAIPALTAFAALGVVPSAPRPARWALAAVVGLGYLPAAYLAQGSFKETSQALLVLAGVLALGDLTREEPPRGWRRGAPVGLLIGASVYNYSYGGAFWMLGAAGVFLVVEVARRPRAALSISRRALVPVLGAVLVTALVLAPEITRIEAFTKSIFGVEPLTNHGNLFHAIDPLETIGLWFSGDFRLNPHPKWPSLSLGVIGLALLVGSVVWWWRRRALAVPTGVLASLLIWIDLALTRNTYNAAKGLVVMAPLVMACAGAPLTAAWTARSRVPGLRRLLGAQRVLGVLLLAGAIVSTFAVLRSAPVGLGPHEQELAMMRRLVHGRSVLFLANDDFAQWELRGALLYLTGPLYAPAHLPMHPQKFDGFPADVDNFESRDLDKMDFILTPGGQYRSEMPPNFRLVMRTSSYDLYRRRGPTPAREPLDPPGQPGIIFDCGSARGKQYLAQYRWAGVLPNPVVSTAWRGSTGLPGHTARIDVRLPPGRWDVSLQYVSFTSLVVRGPQLDARVAPNYGRINAYWPAGTLASSRRGFTLTVTSQERPWFGRLLGTPRPLTSAQTSGTDPTWHVAFTRHGAMRHRVRAGDACGRYVDWFAPAGSAMR